MGMVYAAKLGEVLGISPKGLAENTQILLEKYHLPVSAEPGILEEALGILLADKKAEGGFIHFILIDQIGHAITQKLKAREIQKIIKELCL